ncbi:hypothetical protein IY804_00940 [Campylobacter volucris]|uniref:hypothetical protein n=1 Tax=Campylobacter volucris TaxID=1031542 RepID=UPI0018A0809C|nr:hypothetical protein [Campylobacter volucris]MBF7046657.1 hypothetical protein [Campylobacter volucris]
MKKINFKQHDITNIELILPNFNLTYEQEFTHLNKKKLLRIKENLGFSKHYVSNNDTYASDLAIEALKNTFKNFDKKKLDALIIISPSPDFLAPSMSFIIHNKLNLPKNIIMIDKIGFCTSIIQGIFEAFSLINGNENIYNVIVVYASVINKKIKEESFFMHSSDSASAILIKKSHDNIVNKYTEQSFSEYTLKETHPLTGYKEGIDEFKMDNNIFFSFIYDNFPTFFNNFIKGEAEPDFYLIHSPNKFTYSQITSKIQLDKNKLPNKFGYELFAFTNANSILFDLFLNKNILGHKVALMSQGASINFNAMLLDTNQNTNINLNFI